MTSHLAGQQTLQAGDAGGQCCAQPQSNQSQSNQSHQSHLAGQQALQAGDAALNLDTLKEADLRCIAMCTSAGMCVL
jgi:hypothetical protein